MFPKVAFFEKVSACACVAVAAAVFTLGETRAFAGDAATLLSMTISNGTTVMPRTIMTQTWKFQNTGTTTWSAGSGYTLNIVGTNSPDSLGVVPLTTNVSSKHYFPTVYINSGSSVPPGGTATYSMMFIAPELAGTYTDIFQLNSSSSVFFGPQATIQVTVAHAGSTNQYDRSRAVTYANNNVAYVCSDGYFWTNGSGFFQYGAGTPVPTSLVGDDCAHFVSCCIGNEPHLRGGGMNIATRDVTYGEPGAQRLLYTNLIAAGFGVEVSSLSQMAPGDVIGWNWEGSSDPGTIDHVTLYLGNGLVAAHANSHLEMSIYYYTNVTAPTPVPYYHLVHILDAPSIVAQRVKTNLVVSWRTNWSSYSLYSATSLNPTATWTKVAKTPKVVGVTNMVTNAVSPGAVFYRLQMPGT